MAQPKRGISKEEAIRILEKGEYGVFSTVSEDGQPYGVAVNYYYLPEENCYFFHCGKQGQKLTNIEKNPKVSLFVVGYEEVIPIKYTTHYESAVVTGTASLVTDPEEKKDKIRRICEKFAPEEFTRRDEVIEKYLPALEICKVEISEITGKRNQDD